MVKHSLQLWKAPTHPSYTAGVLRNNAHAVVISDDDDDDDFNNDDDVNQFAIEEVDNGEELIFRQESESESESDCLPELDINISLSADQCVKKLSELLTKVRRLVKFYRKSEIVFRHFYNFIDAHNKNGSSSKLYGNYPKKQILF